MDHLEPHKIVMTGPDYILRSEYEQFTKLYEIRHSELRLEIKDLESGLKTDISNMTVKIDAISAKLARSGVDAWKLLAVSLLNFMLGGGIIGALNYFHMIGH